MTDKIKLISGYEFEHLRAEQNYHVSDWDGTSIIPNTDASNDFTYLRMVHSLYANTDMTFGLWCVNAGLRGEYTDIDNQLKSLAEAAEELQCDNLLVITNSQEEKIEWKRTAILMTSIQNF